MKSSAGPSSRAKNSTTSRRTARVRRAKPNFYDSQEYDKKKRRSKQPTRASRTATILKPQDQDYNPKSKELREARAKQRRIKKEEIIDVDPLASAPPEKQELAKIILAEINRKLGAVVWKPI